MKLNLISFILVVVSFLSRGCYGYSFTSKAFRSFHSSIAADVVKPRSPTSQRSEFRLFSTPFDASLYDDNEEAVNPFTSTVNYLAAPPDTELVIGLNKYSHDTSICAADATSGKVLFALSKERLTRKKHDSGNVALLVETCLDQLELDLDNVVKVVVNNHHHRVLPMEKDVEHLEWETGMGINGGVETGYTDEENLLFEAQQIELSHHLAHAYSAACQSPFESGLVMVMDGMGETYRTMKCGIENQDDSYVCDLQFEGQYECIPSDIEERSKTSMYDWREAESAYEFTKTSNGISVKPIFKRFTQENTPPVLYNHGFENMDSVGALYSRASSHIFGDWNACGKVMGLAPWMGHKWDLDDGRDTDEQLSAEVLENPILKGKLFKEGADALQIDRSYMKRTPLFARNDPDLFDDDGNMVRERRYDFDDNDVVSDDNYTKKLPTNVALEAISLAHRMQIDLETTILDFVRYCKDKTGHVNLCVAGGIALNSVLNGRLSRELGFKNVFIPPYPGDDGIAIGCCAYGLFGNDIRDKNIMDSKRPTLWKKPISPYLGPYYSYDEILKAIEGASPWIEVELVAKDKRRFQIMADELEQGGVVAWFQGRSEIGPRALGHRSILADPRKKGLVRFINEIVKKRESFRPFAPSCLAEEASKWFHLAGDNTVETSNVSPYMSITATVKEDKRELIPAVTHVDGSSRLQTVTKEDEPMYHSFISAFYERTGIPMVLNTSFNTLPGEPIVETPRDAIRSFLCSMGSIDLLVMGDYVIKRKEANVRSLLGETSKNGQLLPASRPKRTGPAYYESKFNIANDDDSVNPVTRVSMPNRPMHDERNGGWYELLDELEGELLGVCNGKATVNDIMNQYNVNTNEDGQETEDDEKTFEYQEILFGNIIRRLIRLYEHTMISW